MSENSNQGFAENGQNGTRLSESKPLLGGRAYEMLRAFVQVILPGAGTLYGTLGTIWKWAYTEEVVSSIAALTLFMGLIVVVARRSYNKSDARYDGVIDVHEDSDGFKKADLVLKNYENPSDVVNQKEVLFKVTGQ